MNESEERERKHTKKIAPVHNDAHRRRVISLFCSLPSSVFFLSFCFFPLSCSFFSSFLRSPALPSPLSFHADIEIQTNTHKHTQTDTWQTGEGRYSHAHFCE